MRHFLRSAAILASLALFTAFHANIGYADNNNNGFLDPDSRSGMAENLAGIMEAQRDTLTFTYAGSTYWTWFQDVVVSGNYAYCAAYNGLIILNISNPDNPTVVSQVYVPGRSVWHPIYGGRDRTIEMSGNHVYMTCQGMGLRIIDVSSPANPVLVGVIDEFDSWNAFWDIRLSGNYAYVASEQGLLVIDISTPSDPQVVARPATIQGMNLAMSGSTIYMGNDLDVQVIDVTLPTSPLVITNLGFSSIEIYTWLNRAYFISSDGDVVIADIEVPSAPSIMDTRTFPRDLSAAYLTDGYLYLGQRGTGSVYATAFDTLEIINLGDELLYDIRWTGDIDNNVYSNLAVFGDQAFLLSVRGMDIVDISTPSSPVLEGGYTQFPIERFTISGNYGYFQSLDTFYVADLTVPVDPTIIGRCPVGSSARVREIELIGDYAYVLLSNCCVKIIDLSTPTAPSLFNELPDSYTDIKINGSRLYAIKYDTLSIFNLVIPGLPFLLGETVAPGSNYRAISISGDYAYVVSENIFYSVPCLLVFNISDPALIDSTGSYYDEFGDPVYELDIQVQGNYAYILGMPYVVDISDPSNPAPLPGSPMPAPLHQATREVLIGDYLIFVESFDWGDPWFDIASISDPAHPTIISSQGTVGFPSDAAIKDNYLYIPEGTGLIIREMTLHSVGSGFFVSNLNSDGGGSLRAAIAGSNSNPGADTILFLVSGIISLDLPLPVLSDDGTVILGSSAPDGIRSVTLEGSALASGNGLEISGSDCTIEGLRIIGFPENGIACTGSGVRNTITYNLIHNNDGLAIDLGNDGVTVNDVGDGDTGPNDLLNYPEIDSVRSLLDETYMIFGKAAPDATVEIFVAHPAEGDLLPSDPSGYGQARTIVGSTTASPTGEFSFHDYVTQHFSVLSTTATDVTGNTSEMSFNFQLLPSPLIVVGSSYPPPGGYSFAAAQNGINIIVEDPEGNQFGRDADNNPIEEIPNAEYWDTPNDSVVIHDPIVGTYIVNIVAENPPSSGLVYSSIIKVDGSQESVLIVDADIPEQNQVDSYTYGYEEGYMYINGDANRDGECNVGDAVFIINYVFKSGSAPDPIPSGDSNCDGDVNVGDAVRIINYVFKGGDPPCQLSQN